MNTIQLPNGYKLSSYTITPNDKVQILYDGIAVDSLKEKGFQAPEKFSFFVENGNKTIGGLGGIILCGEIYIALLWVDPEFREQKIGSRLMQEVEKLGREKKCHFMTVNTFDFQALDFYLKIGFETEFKREGYPKNSTMHFLRKNL
jgi:ribosomal protein S18 acetylase RimI-like enzyme